MNNQSWHSRVGIVGLGLMGGAYASRLLDAGIDVQGYDTSGEAMDRFARLGGIPRSSPADLASRADVILLALPSVMVLDAVVSGANGLCEALGPEAIVCEMGTFPIDVKVRAAEAIAHAGGSALDCPVSGTGAQARDGDLVVFASGDKAGVDRVRFAFDAIARDVRFVGAFGAGMKMKIVANLLVAVHNLAAAEALLLAERSGLDMQMTFDAITAGAGTSRMLEVRGPMMVAESYTPPSMKHDVFMKDLELILEQAEALAAPVPLLAAALPLYQRALSEGRGGEDTASLFGVLKGMVDKTK